MVKKISLLIIEVILILIANVSFIWAIVDFILFLEKDKIFNWLSVWIFIISIVFIFAIAIYSFVLVSRERKTYFEEMKFKRTTPKSEFQKKLEEMARKRINN